MLPLAKVKCSVKSEEKLINDSDSDGSGFASPLPKAKCMKLEEKLSVAVELKTIASKHTICLSLFICSYKMLSYQCVIIKLY